MIYRLYNIIYRLFRVSLYMILGEFIGNLLIDYFRTINRLHFSRRIDYLINFSIFFSFEQGCTILWPSVKVCYQVLQLLNNISHVYTRCPHVYRLFSLYVFML